MEFLGRSYYEDAVYHSYNYGPNFNDFEVDDGPSVCWRGGCIYENDPSWPLKCDEEYDIKEMKVFQVTPLEHLLLSSDRLVSNPRRLPRQEWPSKFKSTNSPRR